MTGGSTELPVVDEVVGLEFRYFGSAQPPQLTGAPLDVAPGPWTTYGPAPPSRRCQHAATGQRVRTAHSGWPTVSTCRGWRHRSRWRHAGGVDGRAADRRTMVSRSLSPARFDADLLRVRRIHVSLRVQSALASLRGPAGTLFARGGTARAGDRYVPDIVVQFDVTPRNMNLAR